MLKDSPDYLFQRQTVEALRADGAQIFETEADWFAEVRSTLKALHLRRTANVKRRLAALTPHAAVFLEDGRGGFVPLADIQAFVDGYGGTVQLVTVSRRSHDPTLFIPWRGLGTTLLCLSSHPEAIA